MQYVKNETRNIHKVFDDIEQIYKISSEKVYDGSSLLPLQIDNSFYDLISLFELWGDCTFRNLEFVNKSYEKINVSNYNPKNIIVCFSGGKDSIASVLHYKKCGYNVYIYYMKRVNPTFFDEETSVIELAKRLEVPYFIDDNTHFIGRHEWVEHPMKNMIIANGALQYGIKNNIGTKIAFGNYTSSTIDVDNFEFCAGDDMELWKAYEQIIRRVIPKFRIYVWLKNLGQTLQTVCKHRELLDLSISCLCRASLRPYRHNWVKEKYGIELPKNRCGSCYKCCVEYIYMTDHNLIEYSKDYYLYCMNRLRENIRREQGNLYDMNYIWNCYMFYPITKSKYFNE